MEGYDANGDPLIQGIVSSTAVLTSTGTLGKSDLGKRLEAAMTNAVIEMGEKGISDPILVKEAMMVAHQRVLDNEV